MNRFRVNEGHRRYPCIWGHHVIWIFQVDDRLDVIFTSEPSRKKKKLLVLDDKNIVVFGFNVRDEPVAVFEHLRSHTFIEQTFRPGVAAGKVEHKKRDQHFCASDERCAAPMLRHGVRACCYQVNLNHGHDACGDGRANDKLL